MASKEHKSSPHPKSSNIYLCSCFHGTSSSSIIESCARGRRRVCRTTTRILRSLSHAGKGGSARKATPTPLSLMSFHLSCSPLA